MCLWITNKPSIPPGKGWLDVLLRLIVYISQLKFEYTLQYLYYLKVQPCWWQRNRWYIDLSIKDNNSSYVPRTFVSRLAKLPVLESFLRTGTCQYGPPACADNDNRYWIHKLILHVYFIWCSCTRRVASPAAIVKTTAHETPFNASKLVEAFFSWWKVTRASSNTKPQQPYTNIS